MEINTRLFTNFKTVHTDNFFFLLNPNDQYISETLFKGIVWEPYVKIPLCLLTSQDDTVVDVGANIGIHTLTLSRLVGQKGTVYSFEPVPLLFTQLSCHCLVNNCFNVKLYQLGLSDSENVSFVPRIEEKDMNRTVNWGNTKLDGENKDGIEIQIKTLDSFEINPQLIKIDAECMELNVLKGMKQTLLRSRPFVIIEIDELESVKRYLQEECDLFYVYNIWTSLTNRKHDYVLVPREKNELFLEKISRVEYPYFKLIEN